MDKNNNNQSIIDGFKVICICRNIRKRTILKAIKKGCETMSEINDKTRTGSGQCQGYRCQEKIMLILEDSKDD